LNQALACARCCLGSFRRVSGEVGCGSEEMSVAGFARAGLAGEDGHEGASVFGRRFVRRRAGGEPFDGGLDCGEVVKAVEAVCAAAEFAGSLGTGCDART
jgi:hypothetical protein